jgi:hypothetical protein
MMEQWEVEMLEGEGIEDGAEKIPTRKLVVESITGAYIHHNAWRKRDFEQMVY